MFDIGGGELILIVLAIIVLFGPKKIPEIAQMFGKGMQQVRKAQAQFQSQLTDIKREIDTTIEADVNSVRRRTVRDVETPDATAGTLNDLSLDNIPLAEEVKPDGEKPDNATGPQDENSNKDNPIQT